VKITLILRKIFENMTAESGRVHMHVFSYMVWFIISTFFFVHLIEKILDDSHIDD
jgi:hypothetical protein